MKKGYCNLWFLSLFLCSLEMAVCSEKEHDLVKKEIIKERHKQQWLWDMAKVVGPLGLMRFTAYQLFKPSTIIEQRTQSVIDVPNSSNFLAQNGVPVGTPLQESLAFTQQETVFQPQQPEIKLLAPMEQQKQSLTKEEILKYKQASHAYGVGAAYFSFVSFWFGKFFYPYAAANFMVSLYYGIKSLQLPLKPVVLKDINIIPDELPY